MFGKAFKPRQHYVFNYKPRYYNERKERIEQLEKKYHGSKTTDNDSVEGITISKSSLKSDWNRHKEYATDRKANLRIAIIVALLVGIAAYLLEIHTLF